MLNGWRAGGWQLAAVCCCLGPRSVHRSLSTSSMSSSSHPFPRRRRRTSFPTSIAHATPHANMRWLSSHAIHMFSNWSTRRFVLPLRISRNVLYLSRPWRTFSRWILSLTVSLVSSRVWARSCFSACGGPDRWRIAEWMVSGEFCDIGQLSWSYAKRRRCSRLVTYGRILVCIWIMTWCCRVVRSLRE